MTKTHKNISKKRLQGLRSIRQNKKQLKNQGKILHTKKEGGGALQGRENKIQGALSSKTAIKGEEKEELARSGKLKEKRNGRRYGKSKGEVNEIGGVGESKYPLSVVSETASLLSSLSALSRLACV